MVVISRGEDNTKFTIFFSWFIIGWLNRGKIKRVEKIGKTEAIKWIETEINEGNVRDVLNRLNENYIGLRYGGLNIGAFKSRGSE